MLKPAMRFTSVSGDAVHDRTGMKLRRYSVPGNYLPAVLAGVLLTLALQGLPADAAASEPLEQPGDSAAAGSATTSGFATDQLEQLVAPIALYPDALLMQILMASTYPLEIVEADRWLKKQPELTGDALNEALKEQDWDPSVKSLTTLPSVLGQMSENLDWTQDLGDAFLAQQNETLDTVQRMRGLAYEAGNLKSTDEQTVTQNEDKIIIVESTNTEVVYVPTYSSTVVYGSSWGYPSYYYPPMYYPPPPGYGMISFGVGIVVGGAIWGDCNWGWGHNEVNIDIDRNNEFNRNTSINGGRDSINSREGGKSAWQHDSSHRKGVNYPSSDVARQFGGDAGASRVTRDQARGHSTATPANRGGAGAASMNRPSTGVPSADRGAGSPRTTPSTADRSMDMSPSTADRSRNSDSSALSGSRSPSSDRASSSRGASSRGTPSYGGSRGGGGGGRRR